MKNSLIQQVVFAVAGAFFLLFTGSFYGQEKAVESGRISGKVVETMDAGGYTYIQVDTGKEKIWAASPQFSVKVGDKVSFSNGMLMENFQSKTLKRTFKTIYFIGKIDGGTGSPKTAPHQISPGVPNDQAHAGLHRASTITSPPPALEFSGLKKPDGGLRVAELYQQMDKLQKKQVLFRGKVVKYNSQVMNKNWVHVQDGTGTPGANDVTVTTDDTAQLGDTVLVKGTVVLNKDYGYGYKYKLVVENAKVAVERPK